MTKKPLDSKLLAALREKYTNSQIANLDLFSPREIEVLELVTLGLSDQSISTQMGLSSRTVENHIHNIVKKIEFPKGVNKRVWLAVSIKLIEDEG